MRFPERQITLKDGRSCILRPTGPEVAAEMIEYMRKTADETPWLLRYPDEVNFTLEGEKDILGRLLDDPCSVMMVAVVDGRVDVNRAGQDLLSGLPGLGSSLAGRIVAEREEHGPYRDADDLLRVPGIGEGKLDALKPYIFAGDVPEAEPTESPAVTSIPSPTPASTPGARSTATSVCRSA